MTYNPDWSTGDGGITELTGDVTATGPGVVASTLNTTLDAVPTPVADVNFADQQALSFRIENRTSDPGSPTEGQIWLRTDL